MNYLQQEKINDLKTYILAHREPPFHRQAEKSAIEADLLWDAGRFLAEVIYAGKQPSRHRTLAQFSAFLQHYRTQNGKQIDEANLFAKHWLRHILGYVRVSKAVSNAVYKLEEILPFKKELTFVCAFYNARSKRQSILVPLKMLEDAVVDYEIAHQVTLNKAGVFLQKWANIKEDHVEIPAMDVHFNPLLLNWDEFEFIFNWLNSCKEPDNNKIVLSKQTFEQIYQRFAHFTAGPTIQDLIDQKLLEIDEDTCYIDIRVNEHRYASSLGDKTGGFLWEKLCNDPQYQDDKERVRSWLSSTFHLLEWPDHLSYVTMDAKERFLSAALALLLEQTDVDGCEEEFNKLLLDSGEASGVEVLYRNSMQHGSNRLVNNNLFELYLSLEQLEASSQRTYLYDQPARHLLAFLIVTIVRHEPEYNSQTSGNNAPLSQILQLLRAGSNKPYYLWKTGQSIIQWRPQILAYLFTEHDLCTLGLSLLDELKFPDKADLTKQIAWKKAISLLLVSLPPVAGNQQLFATIIFQLFRQLNMDKYTIPYTPRNDVQVLQIRQDAASRENTLLTLIEDAPLYSHKVYGGSNEYLVPAIFEQLSAQFLSYEDQLQYRNGVTRFPMIKWDGLFWLMKMTSYWKYQAHFPTSRKTLLHLAGLFLDQYLKSLELYEIVVYDHFENEQRKTTPLWSEKLERLALLDWIYPIYGIHGLGKLNQFLAPRFNFERTEERHHKHNNFTTDKLRTHIGVLLQILRKLVIPSIPYGFERHTLLEIKQRIESQVVEYLRQYTQDVPEEGLVDLLSFRRELTFDGTAKEALLPQLAQAINWFTDKESIIQALLSTEDLVKPLTLLDYIAVEGIKKELLKKIKATDIVNFLENSNWIPEIQTILIKIAQYPELLPQLEEAIQFWKDKVVETRGDEEYKRQLFISQLLVAYFKKDRIALEAVKEPGSFSGSMHELNFRGIKQFHIGLLLIEEEPIAAAVIFNDLALQYPAYSSIALNRMMARLNLGEANNDTTIFKAAYEEWVEHAAKHFNQSQLAASEPELSSCIMTILLALDEHEKIDDAFIKLDLPVRMDSNILTLMIKSLVARKKTAQALHLVDAAKIYHQFSDSRQVQFLDELEVLISGTDDVMELQMHYQRIFRSTPSKLVRILPEAFNGKTDLHQFLLKEFVYAADKLLEKIKSIEKINLEDKYNDLIEVILDARLNIMGWHVDAQSRGAFSDGENGDPGPQPGERDLPIVDSNKRIMLVCEALIYRGESNVVPHLKKIFNYYHQREALILLCYDNATIKKGFEGNWQEYIEKILPATDFPTGMEINGPIRDITNDYGCKASAIRIAMSEHGENTIIYHVFVNILYNLS